MGQYWQYPYNQGIRPPFPGFYPGIQPAGYYPGMYPTPARMPIGQDFYSRQTPTQPEPEKKQPWYVTAGKEGLKIGAIVGASVLGGMFFGVPGALAAGAITSGAVSAIDQKVSKGKIDWGTVTIDTVLGAIPGGAGSAVVKAGQRILGKEIVKHAVKKAAVVGSVDGALMGYAGGAAHTAYDSYKKTGELDLNQANSAGLSSILPGAIGGAIAGGAFTAIGNKFNKKTSSEKSITPEEFARSQEQWESKPPKDIPPPKRNLSNQIITWLRIRSQDPSMGIKNFHRVDDVVFRGAMPESPKAFKKLAESGFDTIIDLRGPRTTSPSEFAFETQWARQENLKYHSIKMDSKNGPDAAGLHQLFWIIEDARRRGTKVYIHCRQGIERTGSMIGAYQMSSPKLSPKKVQLSPEQAYAAMQENGYAFFHKKAHKDFVFNERTPALLTEVQESIALRTTAKAELKPEHYQALCILWEQGKFAEAASQMRTWQSSQSSRHTGTHGSTQQRATDHSASSLSFTTRKRTGHGATQTTRNVKPSSTTPIASKHKSSHRGSRKQRSVDHREITPPFHSEPPRVLTGNGSSGLSASALQSSQRKSVNVSSHDGSISPLGTDTIPPSDKRSSVPGKSSQQHRRLSEMDAPRDISSSSRVPVIHPEPVELFAGVDLTNLHFQQGGLQDCFLLSSIHAAQHHPNGARLLNRIKIANLDAQHAEVYFPGFDEPVIVSRDSVLQTSVSSEKPQIRIIEQAYKQMMQRKIELGDIQPLTGRDLLERLFDADEAAKLLRPYQERNTRTLLQDAFGDPHQTDIDDLVRFKIGDSDALSHTRRDTIEAIEEYRNFLYGLIMSQPRGVKSSLETAFDNMKVEQARGGQIGVDWDVTLPNGNQVRVSTTDFSPTEQVDILSSEGVKFEKLKIHALARQYAPEFMDGRVVTDFNKFSKEVQRLSELAHQSNPHSVHRDTLFQRIFIEKVETGLKVRFPYSGKIVVVPYSSLPSGSVTRLQVVALAAKQAEPQIRLDSTLNFAQPEKALINMFGPLQEVHHLNAESLGTHLASDTILTAVPKADIAEDVRLPNLDPVLDNLKGSLDKPTRGHVYSVRPGTHEGTVIVTDPRNTSTRRYELPIAQFLEWFNVGGVRF